ncbi:MAG: SCO family protein [Polyangiaceae bacterium]|nr:SCO family protein [Polyangiaceae bacterium]
MITRRQWLAAAVAAPSVGAVIGWGTALASSDGKGWRFPNVPLVTHEGRRVRLYDDLLRDKIVIVNFMYSRCRGICPGVTRNMLRVQKLLHPRVGRDIFMYSISIKPQEDTVEALAKYAESLEPGPGWYFLTGDPEDIETTRIGLGAVDPDPAVDADKSQHIGMLRYGNERLERWAGCPGGAKPEWIAKSILWTVAGDDTPRASAAL